MKLDLNCVRDSLLTLEKWLVLNDQLEFIFLDLNEIMESAEMQKYTKPDVTYTLVMLKEAGVTHVILGHSERRKYFGETNEIVNKKIIKALEYGLVPMACCGESLEIRGDGLAKQYIHRQIMEMLQGVQKEDVSSCIFSYEPIWAIGTGIGATKEQAEEGCMEIRRSIESIYGSDVAENVTVLYGGSVNASNADTIFPIKDIDGGLLGTASLNTDFAKVVKIREKYD